LSRITPEQQNEMAKKLRMYDDLFDDACLAFLEDYESGFIDPKNEWELRNFLFAKCLELMKERKFETPYQIGAEDVTVYGKQKADLTLGNVKEWDTRWLTVEIKRFPNLKRLRSDIEKLRRYIEDKLVYAYFVALVDIALREKLDAETLGLTKEQIKSRQVKSPRSRRTKVFLKVQVSSLL